VDCRGRGIAAVAHLRHNARRRWMGKRDTESLDAQPQRLASSLLRQLRRRWGLLVLGHGVTHHHIVDGLVILSLRVASLTWRNASAWRPCNPAAAPRRLARRPPPRPQTPTERSPCPLLPYRMASEKNNYKTLRWRCALHGFVFQIKMGPQRRHFEGRFLAHYSLQCRDIKNRPMYICKHNHQLSVYQSITYETITLHPGKLNAPLFIFRETKIMRK